MKIYKEPFLVVMNFPEQDVLTTSDGTTVDGYSWLDNVIDGSSFNGNDF